MTAQIADLSTHDREAQFDAFIQAAPSAIVEPLRDYWEALAPFYDVGNWLLPLPPWRQRPYTDSGEDAWEILRYDLARTDVNTPICIYLHAPFCSQKCGFCDSYSFKLANHQAERIQDYVDRLCAELRLWSEQGNLSHRPVSTVHLGGGTPTYLGEQALAQIVQCCRDHFAIQPETEWALESTVNELTPAMIQTMHDLGFRRLHIGVQTLEDEVRATIGRRRPARDVLARTEETLARGWVVSVDLICGLPGQTLAGFLDGIETLLRLGVDGFSIYELLIYPQNHRWCERHGLTDAARHLPNYWMFLAGALLLEARGYHKNLFNHWANARDTNVYFTFPTRGEDLLAVGTIADGVFGDYHYRHPVYANYLKHMHSGSPGLEGGLRRDAIFNHAQPLTTALQSGTIPASLAADLVSAARLERWRDCRLIRETASGDLELTPSGSWFTGNLIANAVADMNLTGAPF